MSEGDTRTEHPDVPSQSVDATPTVLDVKPIQTPRFSEQKTKENTAKWMEKQRRQKKRKELKKKDERRVPIRKRVTSFFDDEPRKRAKKGNDTGFDMFRNMSMASTGLLAAALGLLGYAIVSKK